MFCGNCGKKNEEGARFCEFCGAFLAENPDGQRAAPNRHENSEAPGMVFAEESEKQNLRRQQNVQEPPGKKKKWFFLLSGIGVLIIALAIAGILMFRNRQEKQRYDTTLASANRYLEEMDYQKAEDFYLEAISIDPKQKEPYLGLVNSYIAMEEYDRAVETAKKAIESVPEEDRQEFEDVIEKWENTAEYAWVIEPEIEADDITYIHAGDSDNYSVNEREKQSATEYAIFVRDDLLGVIGSDGVIAADPEYINIDVFYEGMYLMTRAEPKYEPSAGGIWDAYFFNEDTGKVTVVDGIGDSFDIGGMYYYCDGLRNVNESEEYQTLIGYQFSEPEAAIGVQKSDALFEGIGGYSDWLDGNYAVYNDGELTTDFIYEECGAESEGLLAAKMNGKWGYITADGTEVIPFEYDASWQRYEGNEVIFSCYAASEGFIPLVKDGVWEMRNIKGDVVIPEGIFDAIRPVVNGKCWVQKDGKWGVIQIESESGDSGRNDTENQDAVINKAKSEEELQTVFKQKASGKIIHFEYDDFDGDGVSEAFGITSLKGYDEMGLAADVEVWYIDAEGNCSVLMTDTHGYLHENKITAGRQKFIVWEISAGGSGSTSCIFGVRESKPYEPEISGQYMWFEPTKYDDSRYTGAKSDFSKGYHDYIYTEFVFDSENGEFVKA